MQNQFNDQIEWDYGDDIKDYELKERKSWNLEMQNNPIYQQPSQEAMAHLQMFWSL